MLLRLRSSEAFFVLMAKARSSPKKCADSRAVRRKGQSVGRCCREFVLDPAPHARLVAAIVVAEFRVEVPLFAEDDAEVQDEEQRNQHGEEGRGGERDADPREEPE